MNGLTGDLYAQELQAQFVLTQAMNFHDQFWREKARNQSFIFAYHNTSYFHKVAKIKSSSKTILFLQNGPTRIENPADIEAHMLGYFHNIFGVENAGIQNDLIASNIPLLVTEVDNIFFLTKVPLLEEIKTVVFDLNGDGAPGPDGFGRHFSSIFWILSRHMWFVLFKIFSIRVT